MAVPFLQLREEGNLPPSPPLESPEPFPCSVRHKDIAGNTNKWWLSGAGILQDDIPLGRLTEMTEWMCQPMMPQEMGLLPRSWWAKQEPVPSSRKKRQTKRHHPRKKSQAGWGLCGSQRLLPVLQLWTPRVTAGHGRSSILRGAPGRALQAGRKAPPLSPPPRPHLGSAGGSARPAPGSSESGPPPYALRGPAAGLVARAAPRPEAGRPGGRGPGWSHPGGQGHCGPRTSFGISAGFTFSICVFLPSPRGLKRAG